VIHAQGLRKRYGDVVAVDDLTFDIKPGIVTGFLGPNGSGKSTTMRMIVGLDAPTSGSVSVNGMRYAGHSAPIHEVGALLEAKAIHPGRTARNHLLAIAATTGIPASRVDEVPLRRCFETHQGLLTWNGPTSRHCGSATR
jgi:ABC-2 type transport system ATP-binding protein